MCLWSAVYFFFLVLSSSLPKGLFFAKSTRIGAATNMEEYVPVITPINIAKEKPRVTSPPKMNKIRMVRNTVREVITVLLKVSLMALLMMTVTMTMKTMKNKV